MKNMIMSLMIIAGTLSGAIMASAADIPGGSTSNWHVEVYENGER